MSENKKTVQDYMNGFTEGNRIKILSCLRDDIVWNMPGFFHLEGKIAFEREIQNEDFEGTPVIHVSRMTEENNVVVAEGHVQCRKKAGGMLDALFCDVFQMENGKIKQLTTYQVNN